MKSVGAKTIVAAWLRIPEISQNLVPCGKGETKITQYTDHKSLAQSPPSRFRALLGDPQAGKESRSQRRTPRAGAGPPGGKTRRRSRAGRKPVRWAEQFSGRFPLQGLGLTSPASGRALECAGRQTHKTDSTICSQERGGETRKLRHKTQGTTHIIICSKSSLYISSRALSHNCAI